VKTSPKSVTLGTPHALFESSLQGFNYGPYDVTRDGKQFLLNGTISQEANEPLTLVTNWFAEIKK